MLNWAERAAGEIWIFITGMAIGVVAGLIANWWATWTKRRRITVAVAAVAALVVAGLTPTAVSAIRDRLDTKLEVLHLVRSGDTEWGRQAYARPGDVVQYRLEITNMGPGNALDVVAGVNAPDYQHWVPGSTYITGPMGEARPVERSHGERGALISGGLVVGKLLPGETAVAEWAMRIDEINVFEQLGDYTLKSVGIGRAPGKTNETYNTAWLDVRVEAAEG